MKKFFFIGIVILFALAAIVCYRYVPSVSFLEASLTIHPVEVSPANNWQPNASVWMGVYNDRLYVIPDCGTNLNKTKYDGWLSCFEKGQLKKLVKLGKVPRRIIGFHQQVLYFNSSSAQMSDSLYSIDFETLQLHQIVSLAELTDGNRSLTWFEDHYYFADDGSVYVPFYPEPGETPRFLHVQDAKLLEICTIPDEYSFGPDRYTLEHSSRTVCAEVVKTSADGTRESLDLGTVRYRSIIPAHSGLLIHNDDNWDSNDTMLYCLTEQGELIELFSVPHMASQSAVTVYGPDVYLSFKRWEKYGDIGMLRYENDTLEGTYKISLEDYSVEKISDKIYDGLYIFDDTGIYACDELCSIYKLDFDGHVIDTLMEVSLHRP